MNIQKIVNQLYCIFGGKLGNRLGTSKEMSLKPSITDQIHNKD